MKKTWMERFGGFMAGKGFYIVLFLCVAAIGISGYYLFSSLNGTDPAVSAAGRAEVTVNAVPSPSTSPKVSGAVTPVKPAIPSPKVSKDPEEARDPSPSVSPSPSVPTVKVEEAAASPSPSPAQTPPESPSPSPTKPVATVYTWPVKGEILHPYSPDLPIMNVTMGDRRVHNGVDIACELGSQVKAAGSGTVASVEEDYFKGVIVTIDHGNGVESVYYNLAGQPVVEAGDTVSVGDVIGAVGNTAKLELAEPAHLHFEMRKSGVSADPAEYLPEMQ